MNKHTIQVHCSMCQRVDNIENMIVFYNEPYDLDYEPTKEYLCSACGDRMQNEMLRIKLT